MKDINVLITAACEVSAPGTIECLKNNGERKVNVIGVDMNPDETMNGLLDKVIRVPRVSDENYVDIILQICKENHIDVILPGISDELIPFEKRRCDFEKIGTRLPVSNIQALDICTNKLNFYNFMAKNGIKVAEYYPVHNISDFENAASKLGYPQKAFVLKTTISSGSRGVRIVDPNKSRADVLFYEKPSSLFTSFSDLKSILSECGDLPEMMAMEYLPGREYSVDVLANHGKAVYICGRDSNSVNASIPMEAVLNKNEEAYNIARLCVELLGLHGNIDLDFKFNDVGMPVLMEINPRRAATMSVFMRGGLNLLYLCVKQEIGEKLPEHIQIKYGTKMKRRYLEQYSLPGDK